MPKDTVPSRDADALVRSALAATAGRRALDCPEAELLGLYAEHALTTADRASVEAHVETCGRCQAIVAAVVRSLPESDAAVAPEAAGADPRTRWGLGAWLGGWRWLVPALPVAAGAVMAVWFARGGGDVGTPDAARVARADEVAEAAPSAYAPATPEPLPAETETPQSAAAKQTSPAAAPEAASGLTDAKPATAAETDLRANTAAPTETFENARELGRAETAQRADVARQPDVSVETDLAKAERQAAAGSADTATTRERAIAAAAPEGRVPASERAGNVATTPAASPAVAAAPPPAPARSAPALAESAVASNARDVAATKSRAESQPVQAAEGARGSAADDSRRTEATKEVAQARNTQGHFRVVNGIIERRLPQGQAWQRTATPRDVRVVAVASPAPNVGWAVGPNVVLRTTDGDTWTRTAVPTSEALAGVSATSATAATVRTVSGVRFTTSDGGRSWQRQD